MWRLLCRFAWCFVFNNGSIYATLLKKIVWFEVSQNYVWSNHDSFSEVFGNFCNVTVMQRSNFGADNRFEAGTLRCDRRVVWRMYIDDACGTTIHLENATFPSIDSSKLFNGAVLGQLQILYKASQSIEHLVYHLDQLLAVVVALELTTMSSTEFNICKKLDPSNDTCI